MRRVTVLVVAVVLAGVFAFAQGSRDLSPTGSASTQVSGKWIKGDRPAFTLGRGSYEGGKWLDITYGRPLKRGRDLWGAGPTYGKDALVGAPIWRAGANQTTRLKTEVPIVIAGKTIAPGEYSMFIDLKENNWTLVVSTWPAQQKYDPNEKAALWGAYGYTADKDVVRARMKLEALPHATEQLTWAFIDMTDTSGVMAITWDKVMASVAFTAGS